MQTYQRALEIADSLQKSDPSVRDTAFNLALLNYRIGSLASDTHESNYARKHLEQAYGLARKIAGRDHSNADVESLLGVSLNSLARLDLDQGNWRMAETYLTEARRHLRTANYRPGLSANLIALASVHRSLNMPDRALAVAKEWAALVHGKPEGLVEVARFLASMIPVAEASERDSLATVAVRTLEEARASGWTDATEACHDARLDPLRHREDFQRLVASLLDVSFPADPFAR
jgi:hypothetical protein